MTRNSPPSISFTLGLLALIACGDSGTEPDPAERLADAGPTFAAAANTWVMRAEVPRDRFRYAAAVTVTGAVRSTLYIIYEMVPALQVYNVATDRWTQKTPMPTSDFDFNGAGVINGKIYLSGGIGTRQIASRSLWRYDPGIDTWSRISQMPSAGFQGVTGVISDELYVLTGCIGPVQECEPFVPLAFYRYNPATNQWATLATPMSSHVRGMGGVIGGKFYVVGGEDGLNRLEVYDPATNQWTTKAPMPLGPFAAGGRWDGAGVALGAKLYVMGGYQRDQSDPDGSPKPVRTNNVYNPATNTWSNGRPMPTARAGIVGSRVVVNGQARIEVVSHGRPGTNLQYIP